MVVAKVAMRNPSFGLLQSQMSLFAIWHSCPNGVKAIFFSVTTTAVFLLQLCKFGDITLGVLVK